MILSDGDILRRLDSGDLVIEPLDDPDLQIQPASVDLRLGREFLTFNHASIQCIRPERGDEIARYVTRTTIPGDPDDEQRTIQSYDDATGTDEDGPGEFVLHPGDFVLGTTKEFVAIPDDIIAHVEGRSSLGRLAIVVHASLPADEEVFVWTPEDGFGLVEIGTLVEDRPTASAVSFDPVTFTVRTFPITNYIRNPARRIVRVTLSSGRQVTVTRDHNLFTLDEDGAVTRIESEEAVGTLVMVPRTLPRPCGPETIDTGRPVMADGGVETVANAPVQACSSIPLDAGFGALVGQVLRQGGANAESLRLRGDTDSLATVMGWCHEQGYDGTWERSDCFVVRTPELAAQVVALVDDGEIPDAAFDWPVPCRTGLLGAFLDGPAGTGTGTAIVSNRRRARRLAYLATGLDRTPAMATRPDGAVLVAVRATPGRDLLPIAGRAVPRQVVSEDSTIGNVPPGLLTGDVRFERVVSVDVTDRVEPVYDLEVQPRGRPVENFLGGDGLFLSNTAGIVDPGYEGQITLELSNLGTAPVALTPDMRIAQVTFTQLTSPAERPYGEERGSKYQGQRGPQASRIERDQEFGGDQR